MTGATRGTWHATHDACRSCGRTDSPHEARGLCHSCYSYLARDPGYWRWPTATDDLASAYRLGHRDGHAEAPALLIAAAADARHRAKYAESCCLLLCCLLCVATAIIVALALH